MKLRLICLLTFATLAAVARETEGARTNSIPLNGPWEFARGDGNEAAEAAAGQRQLQWQSVTLPGPFLPYSNRGLSKQSHFGVDF